VKTTGPDGLWGPFRARPDAYYEFVFEAPGHPITHIYRSPFARSSDVVHFRPRDFAKGDDSAGSVVLIQRISAYFGHGRDVFLVDNETPKGIAEGVPADVFGKVLLPSGPSRAVPTRLNDEHITVRNWPAKDNHVVIAQFAS